MKQHEVRSSDLPFWVADVFIWLTPSLAAHSYVPRGPAHYAVIESFFQFMILTFLFHHLMRR